jgi:predicted ATPase
MINPSILEIRLLGPVEIHSNGERIKIPRKMERGLLYYLAVENRPVSRTALIDLLWPEADQIDPRRALRTALSRLRKNLPEPRLVITDLDQVALDTGRCWIDLQAFQKSFLSLRGILSALPNQNPLPVQIVNQIKEALALWRGNRVIQGDDLSSYQELDRWRQNLRRKLNLQREFLIRRLAAHYQSSGQLELAMDLYINLGRMNYQDNVSHLAVIDILTKLGRHQEALEYCDALEVIFEREFGEPLPDEIIKYCQTAQRLIHSNDQRVKVDWHLLSSMVLPLVGRTNELSQLRQSYYRGGVVIIQGNFGIGKSRLMQEFHELLSPKPMLFLATVRENENILPLSPMINAFRRYLPDEIWHDIDVVWANQLTLLFPELTEIRSDCSLSGADKFPAARQHLFDAIHQLLSLAARRYGRVLFFLDDAHWADHQTLQALLYLVLHGFFDNNGLLVIAKQNDLSTPEIDEFINQIHHNHQVQVIDLPGLNPDELRILMDQVLERPPLTSFVDQLYRETEGNPFVALEILRYVLENQIEAEDLLGIDHLPMPDSIQDLIRTRLNTFSEDSRLIITCAALIRSNISLSMLQAVTGVAQNEFISTLNPLIETGFLRTNTDDTINAGTIFISNEKVRDVVLEEATPAYLQILHQRTARYLSQDTQSSENAAVIADHFLAAGEPDNAFRWHLKAAEHAWSLGAGEDVLRNLQQAERLIKSRPQGWLSLNEILTLYKIWWDYAYQSNQIDMLEEIGIKIQRFAKHGHESHVMGLSNTVLANACFMREDFETALMLAQTAIKQLETTDDTQALLQALFHQGLIRWWVLDFEGVLRTAETMLETIRNNHLNAEQLISSSFNTHRMIAEAYHAQGEADKAVESAQATYREFFHQLNTFDRLRAYNMMALSHFSAGNISESIRFAEEGLETVHKVDNTFFEGLLLISLCKAEIIRGRLDDAYQHGTQALKFAENDKRVQSVVAANMLLGDIFNILHNTNQALQHYRIAQVRQGYSFQSYYGLENNIHLSRLLTRTGELVEAREILIATLAVTEEKGIMHLHPQALLAEGLLDLQEEYYPEAEGKFSLALAIAEQKGLMHEAIWGKFRLAAYAFTQKRYDLAENLLIDVLATTKLQEMPLLNLHALEFFWQLKEYISIRVDMDELRDNFQVLADKLNAQTQSPALKPDFQNVQRYWREQGYYS